MYKHILVPTDGTPLSLKAVKAAAGLARALKARITTLYVIAPFSPPMDSESIAFRAMYSAREYEQGMRKHAAAALARAKAAAKGVECQGISAIQANPWQAIVSTASSKKCDLIVMASHGRRGLAGLLLGSETQKVLTHSKTPVLVCR